MNGRMPIMRWLRRHELENYGKRGPVWYRAKGFCADPFKNHVVYTADLEVRVNGPNTAMVRLHYANRNFPLWPCTVYRHFKGKDAAIQARKWCRWFLAWRPHGVEQETRRSFTSEVDSILPGWEPGEEYKGDPS